MPKKNFLSNSDVAVVVEKHGLTEAITEYVSSDQIEDPVLSDAWERAAMALEEITETLEISEETPEEEEVY